jgi:predicted HAD superfamily phosphohydrolase YqeG
VRKVPLIRVADLDDVARRCAAATPGLIVIFDADNTLVPQRVSAEVFAADVRQVIDRFGAIPSVARVLVLTNGPPRGLPDVMSRGNKPWTSRRRLGLDDRRHPVWVVGDQILTDGFLAWRLGAPYLQLVIDEEREQARQSVMRRIGRLVQRRLFDTAA